MLDVKVNIILCFRIAFKYINLSLEALKKKSDDEIELTLLQSMLLTKGLDVSGAMVTVADMLMAGIDTVYFDTFYSYSVVSVRVRLS